MDADLLGELPLVEPRVPELTNELIDLGLVAAPARALDVMHPSLSPDSEQIGNHGVHRTLTNQTRKGLRSTGTQTVFQDWLASEASQSWAAKRMDSPVRTRGTTNLGVNQGKAPTKSWVTKI